MGGMPCEAESADGIVPRADDQTMMIGTGKLEDGSGRQFTDTINQAGEEPRRDEASCRESISRAAANSGTRV